MARGGGVRERDEGREGRHGRGGSWIRVREEWGSKERRNQGASIDPTPGG